MLTSRRSFFALLAAAPAVGAVAVATPMVATRDYLDLPLRATIHAVEFGYHAPASVAGMALEELMRRVGPSFRADHIRYLVFKGRNGEQMIELRYEHLS